MCLTQLKYFLLIFIGVGIVDLMHDYFRMLPSRLRVADLKLDNAHT